MVIRPSDRVAALLERDERLVDVLAAASPTFERLRNRAMRKVMARLVTVEQAARIAGLEPAELVARLQAALDAGAAAAGSAAPEPGSAAPEPGNAAPTAASSGAAAAVGSGSAAAPADHQHVQRTEHTVRTENEPAAAPAGAPQPDPGTPPAAAGDPPAHLAALPPDLIVDLDVRPELRRGEEPFSKIMAARRALPEGAVLRLRATFEPVPLYAVLGKQGLAHWTERLADDDWRVWFYPERPGAPAPRPAADPTNAPGSAPASASASPSGGAPASAGAAAAAPDADDNIVVLDVRGLEPPEPMQRTLEALEALPPGKTLVQINVREPRFLLPLLAERGWTYEVRRQGDELVRTFIRRRAEP
ncbi:MAG: DUF2249 domain-containing protein [Gemmatimonadetes bacterium]|nr:DUF2249 domain-containing protein [Gemmatimonadota bacterium]